ncbi:hypothetical protein [Kitasatospora viridis]|nr:hypothetical protein [Kitasatospora viridis]
MLLLLLGLVSGTAIPAQAAYTPPPAGGMNQCLVLAICIELNQPGSGGAPGGSGGSTGGGSGGGDTSCTWKGLTEPCWDGDYGWFNTDDGCYYRQADSTDPLWSENPANSGAAYARVCFDSAGGESPAPSVWLAQPPNTAAPPPSPATVGQMAFNQLPFELPIAHVAPQGKSLVGVPTFLWFDTKTGTRASELGDLQATVTLSGVTVTATAHVTSVVWDLGFKSGGTEATQDCTSQGTGVVYTPGMEQNPPAGACLADYGKLVSPTDGAAPTSGPAPSGPAAPGGGFWPRVILTWHVTTTGDVWGPLDLQITSAPVQLQINSLNVLN